MNAERVFQIIYLFLYDVRRFSKRFENDDIAYAWYFADMFRWRR